MITSSSNSKIKHVCQLVTKAKARRTEQLFVVEGIRMAKEAPKELLKEVYVSTSFLQKKEQSKLLETLSVPYEEVSDDVFAKMSDTVTPQGVLCVPRQPSYDLDELLGRDGTFLVLEDIQDPGNLGTMLRTGEGAGITAVIMSKKTADLFNPKTIRSTMGSVYRVPFCYVEDLKAVMEKMHAAGIQTYAAHLQGKNSYTQECYSAKTAFLIGNEGNGLSDEIAALAMCKIRIPMEGQVESLNAAVSAAILMYEAKRQNN